MRDKRPALQDDEDPAGAVELAVYPEQGHTIASPRLQLDMLQRNVDWFERWIRGEMN